MIETQEELAVLLAGTTLANRAIRTVPIRHDNNVGFAIDCAAGEALSCWAEARALVDATGRWPLLMDTSLRGELGGLVGPEVACAAAEVIDAASAITWKLSRGAGRPLAMQYELDATARRFGAAPSLDEMPQHLLDGEHAASRLDRWLLDWEMRQPSQPALRGEMLAGQWPPRAPLAVTFLPTKSGYHGPAYEEFYGMGPDANREIEGTVRLIALLREWQRIYEAELVFAWGVILLFQVGRPPRDVQQAWDLACQHDIVAGGTTNASSVREYARELLDSRYWVLFERP